MPLYNCFSNRACEKLKISAEIVETVNRGTNNKILTKYTTKFTFDTSDPNYKIYMVPVKLFQDYTIAIDSDQPIELCCGIYSNYQDIRTKFDNLPKLTYQKVNQSQFTKPFLYTKINLESLEK
jgi:hypothetical protein